MTVFSTPERVVISLVRGVTSWSMSRSTVTIVVSRFSFDSSFRGDRADDVVGLVAGHLVDRDPQCLDDLAHLGELVPQVVRHALAGRLVLGVLLVAEGRPGEVERHRQVVRPQVRDAAQHDAREAEHAVHELAAGGRQRRQREISAVHETVAIEQHQAFGGHVRKCSGGPDRRDRFARARELQAQARSDPAAGPAQHEQPDAAGEEEAREDGRSQAIDAWGRLAH